MITHLLLRNLTAGKPSLHPHFDILFDAARPQEQRGDLPRPMTQRSRWRASWALLL
jgi:hypothetical protein